LAANIVDARGRSCPEPVVMTKRAMENSGGELIILVDTETARDNVKRFAENSGCQVSISTSNDEYQIKVSRQALQPR